MRQRAKGVSLHLRRSTARGNKDTNKTIIVSNVPTPTVLWVVVSKPSERSVLSIRPSYIIRICIVVTETHIVTHGGGARHSALRVLLSSAFKCFRICSKCHRDLVPTNRPLHQGAASVDGDPHHSVPCHDNSYSRLQCCYYGSAGLALSSRPWPRCAVMLRLKQMPRCTLHSTGESCYLND